MTEVKPTNGAATAGRNAAVTGQTPDAPDMRVVTKGWWTLREERVPVEELERQDQKRLLGEARRRA